MSSARLPDGETRARILRMVREGEEPVSVQQLASALGIHPNTARFHLDALVRQGALERDPDAARARSVGRPALRYRRPRRMSAGAGRADYRLLATVLVGHLAAGERDPAAAALEIGRANGALLLAEADPPATRRSGVERMVGALERLGFQPEPAAPGADEARVEEIRLRHCPFLDLADAHAEVTCPLHLGLLQGALDAIDSPVTATGIEPFAQPDLCVVRLGPRSER